MAVMTLICVINIFVMLFIMCMLLKEMIGEVSEMSTTKQMTFKQYLINTYPQDKAILVAYDEEELICLYSSTYTKYLGIKNS